jgi:Fur family peroxide stress response transcriptional regulator
MSFATVYNTLDALLGAGHVATLNLGPGPRGEARATRFDPNTEPHHHAVCDVCGSITDVPATTRALVASDALVSAAPGFEVRTVERLYRGVCAECAGNKGNEKLLS